MATAKDILKIAAKEIGVKESPPNSNKVKYSKEYGYAAAWCAMFVWWVFKQAGAKDLYYGGKKTAYTPTLQSFYKKKGQLVSKPKVGDIVFFNWGGRPKGTPEHVGIVEKVIDSRTIQTIEGNTSTGSNSDGGQVMRRKRSLSSVCGIARPKYSGTSTAPSKPASKPSSKPYKVAPVKAPSWPLYDSQWYGPGSVYSGEGLRKWQAQMRARGWTIGVDGIYGPETAKVAGQFQLEKKIRNSIKRNGKPDQLVGKATFTAAWTEKVT